MRAGGLLAPPVAHPVGALAPAGATGIKRQARSKRPACGRPRSVQLASPAP